MAVTRIIPLHVGGRRSLLRALGDTINYVKNPEKTEGGDLVTAYQCNPSIAAAEFKSDYRMYQHRTGRKLDPKHSVIAYHLRQSFVPGEVTAEEANAIGRELAMRYTHGEHAFLVCTHIDRAHIHNHIIINAVNLEYSRKLDDVHCSGKVIGKLSDMICLEHGLSVLENAMCHGGKTYNKWQGYQPKPTHRDHLRQAIDETLMRNPRSMAEFCRMLSEIGYEVKRPNGNNPSFRGAGQERFLRLDTLGEGYTLEHLLAVFRGEESHTANPNPKAKTQPTIQENPGSLLIDINRKMQEGKGGAYAHWAQNYNIREVSKTFQYLRDHGIDDYADLDRRAKEATDNCEELRQEMQKCDNRMQEISLLRKHIAVYARTVDVYRAYRDTGFDEAYLAEHREDIDRYRAAQTFFDDLPEKRLPNVTELADEYDRILDRKRQFAAEYKRARAERNALIRAKDNVRMYMGQSKEEI